MGGTGVLAAFVGNAGEGTGVTWVKNNVSKKRPITLISHQKSPTYIPHAPASMSPNPRSPKLFHPKPNFVKSCTLRCYTTRARARILEKRILDIRNDVPPAR